MFVAGQHAKQIFPPLPQPDPPIGFHPASSPGSTGGADYYSITSRPPDLFVGWWGLEPRAVTK